MGTVFRIAFLRSRALMNVFQFLVTLHSILNCYSAFPISLPILIDSSNLPVGCCGHCNFWSLCRWGSHRQIVESGIWRLTGDRWCSRGRGPNTVPWGTPESTLVWLELHPSITTCILLSVRKERSQSWMEPLMPYLSSFWRRKSGSGSGKILRWSHSRLFCAEGLGESIKGFWEV